MSTEPGSHAFALDSLNYVCPLPRKGLPAMLKGGVIMDVMNKELPVGTRVRRHVGPRGQVFSGSLGRAGHVVMNRSVGLTAAVLCLVRCGRPSSWLGSPPRKRKGSGRLSQATGKYCRLNPCWRRATVLLHLILGLANT